MGKFRKLFLLIAVTVAFVGASAAPANAGAQRAFCHSKGGTPATGANGLAECWVGGKNIYAPR